jgi:hypothetical protein
MARFIVLRHTATNDLKFKLTYNPLWCREANIHILTNAACYGDSDITTSDPSIAAGNGISFQDFDVSQIFFINAVGGSNTTIVAECIPMTEGRKQELGVI